MHRIMFPIFALALALSAAEAKAVLWEVANYGTTLQQYSLKDAASLNGNSGVSYDSFQKTSYGLWINAGHDEVIIPVSTLQSVDIKTEIPNNGSLVPIIID